MAHAMILDTGKPDDNPRDPNASPVRLSKPFVVMPRGESVGCLLSTCLLVLRVPTRPRPCPPAARLTPLGTYRRLSRRG